MTLGSRWPTSWGGTRLHHDANIIPWVLAAREAGAVIRWADIRDEECTLTLAPDL